MHARLQASGFDLIGLAEGLAALQVASSPASPSVLAVVPARWDVVLGSAGVVPAFLSTVAPQLPCGQAAASAVVTAACQLAWGSSSAWHREAHGGRRGRCGRATDGGGVDSLGAVELRNQLQAAAGDSQSLAFHACVRPPDGAAARRASQPCGEWSSHPLCCSEPGIG